MRLIHLLASLAIFVYSAMASVGTNLIVVRLSGGIPEILLTSSSGKYYLPLCPKGSSIWSTLVYGRYFADADFNGVQAHGGTVEVHNPRQSPMLYQTVMVESLPNSNLPNSKWISLKGLLTDLHTERNSGAYSSVVSNLLDITSDWGRLTAEHYPDRSDIAFTDPRPRFFTYVNKVADGPYKVLLASKGFSMNDTLIPIDMEQHVNETFKTDPKKTSNVIKEIGGVSIRFYMAKDILPDVRKHNGFTFTWNQSGDFVDDFVYPLTRDLPNRPEFKEVLASLEAGSP